MIMNARDQRKRPRFEAARERDSMALGPRLRGFFGRGVVLASALSRYKPHDRTNKTGTRVGTTRKRDCGGLLAALGEERWPISRYSAHMP